MELLPLPFPHALDTSYPTSCDADDEAPTQETEAAEMTDLQKKEQDMRIARAYLERAQQRYADVKGVCREIGAGGRVEGVSLRQQLQGDTFYAPFKRMSRLELVQALGQLQHEKTRAHVEFAVAKDMYTLAREKERVAFLARNAGFDQAAVDAAFERARKRARV
jgi:hypothetical protein